MTGLIVRDLAVAVIIIMAAVIIIFCRGLKDGCAERFLPDMKVKGVLKLDRNGLVFRSYEHTAYDLFIAYKQIHSARIYNGVLHVSPITGLDEVFYVKNPVKWVLYLQKTLNR